MPACGRSRSSARCRSRCSSLWVGQRPTRRWWMAAGVVASALIFGFAHSNYESWPPYSRGVEIFLDACFWAVLFINFGLLVTVVAHFVYDLVLFGLFAASGNGARIPHLGGDHPARAARAGARGRVAVDASARTHGGTGRGALRGLDARRISGELATLAPRQSQRAHDHARAGSRWRPPLPASSSPWLGRPSPHSARSSRPIARTSRRTADSVLRAHGGDPAGWTRPHQHGHRTRSRRGRDSCASTRSSHRRSASPRRIIPPAWWVVRYVHTKGTAAQRTEEWRVRLWPDGRPLDARHIIPDSARRNAAATGCTCAASRSRRWLAKA